MRALIKKIGKVWRRIRYGSQVVDKIADYEARIEQLRARLRLLKEARERARQAENAEEVRRLGGLIQYAEEALKGFEDALSKLL